MEVDDIVKVKAETEPDVGMMSSEMQQMSQIPQMSQDMTMTMSQSETITTIPHNPDQGGSVEEQQAVGNGNADHVKNSVSDNTEPAPNPNPWNAKAVQDFCFYNCPECDFKAKSVPPFKDHAMENHPLVRSAF